MAGSADRGSCGESREPDRSHPSGVRGLLRNKAGEEIASVAAVDGASGVLESDVLRKALTSYRDSGNVTHEAQLVAVNELGHEEVVNFSILTREQEQSLHEALGEFDSSHGIFRHVERASVFESAGMYDHVASEYDAALNEAPSSHDMLQAALNAHARIGNLRRARELRDKLQEIEALAETRK